MSCRPQRLVLVFLLLLLLASVIAFQPPGVVPHPGNTPRTTTRRQLAHQGGDISEWRDLVFENPPIVKQPPQQLQPPQEPPEPTEPLREICVLPFPLIDVLLQGETKELCLYEERFHKLFEYATTHHAGIVAMGFMAPPSGLLQTMPLCEIEQYRTMEAATATEDENENDDNNRSAPQEPLYSSTGKSIMATIRVVGRATLQQIQNNERTEPKDDDDESREKLYHDDYITAWCTELTDDNSHTSTSSSSSSSSPAANAGVQNGKNILDVCNELADDIEEMFDSIITLKKKQDITEAAARQQQQEQDDDDDEVSASSSSSFATAREDEKKENNVFSAATLRRMKLEAELDLADDDDDDDDDNDDNDDNDDDDDDSIDDEGDLKKILQKAFRVAKASDTQGYTIVSSSSTIASTGTNNEEEEENKIKSKKKKKPRSIQDLTAMSWAYLNNDVWSNPSKDQEYGHILKYRLQALNVTNLLDRLVLIYKMMLEQRGELLNLDGDDKAWRKEF